MDDLGTDDLDSYLVDIVEDERRPIEARRLAAELQAQWSAGLVPSRRKIAVLRRMLEVHRGCARLRPDGSCPWLRKNAKLEGLRPPGPGERVYCRRKAGGGTAPSFEQCLGYRKLVRPQDVMYERGSD